MLHLPSGFFVLGENGIAIYVLIESNIDVMNPLSVNQNVFKYWRVRKLVEGGDGAPPLQKNRSLNKIINRIGIQLF